MRKLILPLICLQIILDHKNCWMYSNPPISLDSYKKYINKNYHLLNFFWSYGDNKNYFSGHSYYTKNIKNYIFIAQIISVLSFWPRYTPIMIYFRYYAEKSNTFHLSPHPKIKKIFPLFSPLFSSLRSLSLFYSTPGYEQCLSLICTRGKYIHQLLDRC
mgnify:CR=1 FL=1